MFQNHHELIRQKIEGWLTGADSFWVSTTHIDGRPHLSLKNGIWQLENEQPVFYFYAEPESWTAQNLAVLPHAVLQFHENEKIVVVEGRVRPILNLNAPHLAPIAAKYALQAKDKPLFRVEALNLRAWQLDLSPEPVVLNWPVQGGAAEEQTAIAEPQIATSDQPDQPTNAAHPGSKSYPYIGVHEDTWEIWHKELFFSWSTKIHLFAPQIGNVPPGGFGVLAVSPGFELGSVSYYREFLEHVARKGYIVLFISTQAYFLDDDHLRQAGEFLDAVKDALENHFRPGEVSKQRVGWWAHSIGCKVQALASQMTGSPNYIKPAFIIGAAYSDQKVFHRADALTNAADTPETIAYTLLPGDRDQIAPTATSLALFEAMPQVTRRQIIQVSSYQPDGLIANHGAPMSRGKIPVIGTQAEVDALDWYGYWKWTVGALAYHFNGQTDSWTYGADRLDGGTDKRGVQILHKLLGAFPA